MPLYRYTAQSKAGDLTSGIVDAANEDTAADIVLDQGLSLLTIEEYKEKTGLSVELRFLERVKIKDLVIFSRQLSVMVSAEVPIMKALKVLVEQTVNPKLKRIVSELADDIEGGGRLSDSMAKHKDVFDDFFVSIIRSGETSGKLDEILNYLADQMEKDYDLRSKIKGAMIYPIFIFSGLTVVGWVMMTFVIPKLTETLKESGAELPFTTKALIVISDFMSQRWYLVIGGLIALVIGLRSFIKSEQGKYYWDLFKLKIPVFGKLFKYIYLVRFTRSFATLLVGGVEIVDSLKIVADVVGNEIYKDLINRTVKDVEDGNPIATNFLRSKDVPVMISHMLSIGEQTGRIDKILEKLTSFYSREIDNMVSNLVTLLEPLIMVLMGLGVGVMVSAIIMPMYSLANQM